MTAQELVVRLVWRAYIHVTPPVQRDLVGDWKSGPLLSGVIHFWSIVFPSGKISYLDQPSHSWQQTNRDQQSFLWWKGLSSSMISDHTPNCAGHLTAPTLCPRGFSCSPHQVQQRGRKQWGEIKRETTGIQEQHIRWDVGTAGLIVPNEPQQSSGCLLFVEDSVLVERFEHDEWQREGILAMLGTQPSHWLLYRTEMCPCLKLATLGTVCNIDLTEWRSEWEQNPAKKLKQRSFCQALCNTEPMAKRGSPNLARMLLWIWLVWGHCRHILVEVHPMDKEASPPPPHTHRCTCDFTNIHLPSTAPPGALHTTCPTR